MKLNFYRRIKRSIARLLAKFFHRVCDPQLEFEWSDPDDYAMVQDIRRNQLEDHINKYLGPRL